MAPATVRLWCKQFQAAIPISKDANGRWEYTPDVLHRFGQAQKALTDGKTYVQVAAMIESGDIDDIRTSQVSVAVVPPALTGAIDDMRQEIAELRGLVQLFAENMKALPHANSAQMAALEAPANVPQGDSGALMAENVVLKQALEEARQEMTWRARRRLQKAARSSAAA